MHLKWPNRIKLVFNFRYTNGCSPESNLVFKAYPFLKEDFNLPDLKFHLHKVIPFGAGLGGGSSDAAFTLKLLNDYFKLGLNRKNLKNMLQKLAPIVRFLSTTNLRLPKVSVINWYRIEIDLSNFHIVILKPDISVGTPDAYRNIIPRNLRFNLKEMAKIPAEKWKENVENDFEKNIFPHYPEIKEIKGNIISNGRFICFHVGKRLGCLWNISPFTDKFR